MDIPPGFESSVPFTLKRMEDDQLSNNSTSAILLETQCDDSKTSTSLRHTPLIIKHNQLETNSNDQIELEQGRFSSKSLPKGVIRGCEACENCQKVIAKWRPEEGRRPDLEEAPVFYPSEEEFEDTVKYISSIRSQAEMYGICRIVPPPSWIPPCPLKEKNVWERCKFITRTQRIDKLQNRDSMRKIFQVNQKRRKCRRRGVQHGDDIPDEAYAFGFEAGPYFTLDQFHRYDDDFKAKYFSTNNNPTVKDIEGEYWRMVEKPTEEIEVVYGADLETGVFGSGFPNHNQAAAAAAAASASELKYINSGWNLNNFPRLPGSVLSFEGSDISGVMVPWLYIGMCFSSFCWHVEDHHMYSLNYLHWGAPKVWYGVPGSGATKLEATMRKHLPHLFEEQPDLLNKLVTQLSPSIIRSEGVPVYRCVQNAGEFVLTFPRAYHAGFNCGFNCAEAVNIAPVDWLPHGHNAVHLYREQRRRTSISHDKLLLGAAREAVKESWEHNFLRKYRSNVLRWSGVCGKDGILSKALKTRVKMEREWREVLSKSWRVVKMESTFDASSERECSVCLFDLHLAAAGCEHCSPDKYACLNHAKQLCSCPSTAKFFLFRYDIMELNMLVEALEGKLSAVYRWARLDLGLPLISEVNVDKKHEPGLMKVSHASQASVQEEMSSAPSVISSRLQKKQVNGNSCSVDSSQNVEPPMVVLALECAKKSDHYPQKVKSAKSNIPFKTDNSPPRKRMESCQASLRIEKQSSFLDIVHLSDDEGDEPPNKKLCVAKETSQKHSKRMNSDSCNITLPTSTCIKPESCVDLSMTDTDSNKYVPRNIDTNYYDDEANAKCPKLQIDDEKLKYDGHKKLRLDVELRSTDNMLAVSSHQNNLDVHCHQKGPRIARVIRRINCNVEALNFGGGKLWCDSHAIYPKGFRSRVRYTDVTDPTNTCYYVSEILDAGLDRPLFMVSLESDRSEVFIHVSAVGCWELVRERVNIEKHKLGSFKLRPPGTVNGMQMFGFLSPPIMQAIEAMDQNRVCKEYWQSRPLSEPVENTANPENNTSIERILYGFFQKANVEELDTLYSFLRTNKVAAAQEPTLLTRLLTQNIKNHRHT